ncbi:MerR family transcriptional regulator [Pseudonocardia endophytica]|uniref:DNA-binding transcriptional MerR regulator n=1 Tax=Pseudonocardia endophytica TaxID=401976 RepID=A0A4V2PHS5_PSEEN|nr:MerR family transcriptional regulator [Pseudonocardia endophytica]TCK21916.1 DNA-binding transcriptional MerR regulator [Pseudonocardia endophytica]
MPDTPPAASRGPATPAGQGGVYRVQEAARIADVSPTTVRVWERNGLVSAHRGSNGYRYFNEADLQRIRRIAHLRKVKRLNIEGIRRALHDSDESVSASPPVSAESTIGPRLRKLRQDAGMTLGQAAELAELSPSFLSALERDQTGVSSQSLHRLTHAYGSTVSAVLRSDTTELVQLSPAGKRKVSSVHGFRAEHLINGQTMLDGMLITLEPSSESSGPVTHEGEEIIYILEGVLDVRLGTGQRFKVRAGESLFYPSTIEHEWTNTGSGPTRFLWVATPPSY